MALVLLAAASLGLGVSGVGEPLRSFGDMPSRPRVPARQSRDIMHIDSPKPVSKRKARRLRGRGLL